MPSKMVTDREKVDEALVAALATHRGKVLEGLQERLGPWLAEGVDAGGFAPYYDALAALIAAHKDRLAATDRRTQAERLDDRLPRRQRDEVAAELRQTLLVFRRVASVVFGENEGKELSQLDGRLSTDAKVVHRAALDVLEHLQNPSFELPASDLPGVQVTAPEWVARIEPLAAELGAILDTVVQNRQQSGGMTVEKSEALTEHDREVRLARRFLLSVLRLADQEELADLVRRAIRRRAPRSAVEVLEETAERAAGNGAHEEGSAPSDTPPAGETQAEEAPTTPVSPAAQGNGNA